LYVSIFYVTIVWIAFCQFWLNEYDDDDDDESRSPQRYNIPAQKYGNKYMVPSSRAFFHIPGGVWSKPGCIIASPVRACNYFNSPRDACTTTGSRIFLARRRPNASDSGWKRNCLFAPGSLLIHTGHGDAFQLRRVTQATRVSHHSHGTTKGLLFPPPATENAVVVKRFLQSCAFNCRWRPCCSLSAEQDYLLLKPTYGF